MTHNDENDRVKSKAFGVEECGESSRTGALLGHSSAHISQDCEETSAEAPDKGTAERAKEFMNFIRQDYQQNGPPRELLGNVISDGIARAMQTLTEEQATQMVHSGMEIHNRVTEEIRSKGPGILRRCINAYGRQQNLKNRVERQKNINDSARDSANSIVCGSCSTRLGIGCRFYRSIDTVSDAADEDQPSPTHLCLTCFFDGKGSQQKSFQSWEVCSKGLRPTPTRNHDRWDPAILEQLPPVGQHHLETFHKDSPISQILQRYLGFINLDKHQYRGPIAAVMGLHGPITTRPALQMLKNWALICFLVSDFGFPKRTGQIYFMALLSPPQRVSLRLIKEWWFSEIQNSIFVMKTIASLAKDCMQPPTDTFHSSSNYEKNKYTEDYHGDLLKLFEEEFQTLNSGKTLSTPEMLPTSRLAAANSACRQRMGSEASCGLQNPNSSSVIGQELGEVFTSATVDEFCRRWRQSVRFACMDLLWMIRLSNAPEEAAETFWLVMDFVTEGPIELFKRDLLRPDMILESSRMSVSLEPLPWLAVDAAKNEDRPFYLWDRRDSRTVETENLPLPLEYVAVSHTWGRWKIDGQVVKLPGVNWEVPVTSIWDTNEMPEMLRKVPGHQRFVWFDLVCIPQGRTASEEPSLGMIATKEIAKQAVIFNKAAHVVAWMSTMGENNLENLRETVTILSIGSGAYYKTPSPTHGERTEAVRSTMISGLKARTFRSAIPMVENNSRHKLRNDRCSHEHINMWFTSLWTLQEVCIRPDMWICDKSWNLLRLRSTPIWEDRQNISFDAIFSLIEAAQQKEMFKKLPGPSHEGTQEQFQAKFDKLNDHLRNANISDFRDWAKMKSFFDDADIPLADYAILDAEEIKNIYTGAGSASRGLGSRAQFGPWMNLPLDIHYLRGMLQATRMLGLGEMRSRMDILVMGERRTCMMRRSYDRAQAIMSAVGAIEWYYKDHERNSALILGQYPAAFIAEVRNKAGHADFFRSRTLNKRALEMIRDWQNHTALDSSKYVPIGSLLPFSNSSVYDVVITPINWPNDSLPLEGQSALSEWIINDDGSVYIKKAAVVVNTSRPRPMPDCHIRCFHPNFGKGGGKMGEDVSLWQGSLAGWLEEQKNISGNSYLVNLSRQRLHMKERMGWSSCHGVILKELRPGVLVKIGMYALTGHELFTWPPATRRNWTVL